MPIDIALWDILGKSLGVPVYKLLGGKVRNKVVCYTNNSYISNNEEKDIETLIERAKKAVSQGWRFLRLTFL